MEKNVDDRIFEERYRAAKYVTAKRIRDVIIRKRLLSYEDLCFSFWRIRQVSNYSFLNNIDFLYESINFTSKSSLEN